MVENSLILTMARLNFLYSKDQDLIFKKIGRTLWSSHGQKQTVFDHDRDGLKKWLDIF